VGDYRGPLLAPSGGATSGRSPPKSAFQIARRSTNSIHEPVHSSYLQGQAFGDANSRQLFRPLPGLDPLPRHAPIGPFGDPAVANTRYEVDLKVSQLGTRLEQQIEKWLEQRLNEWFEGSNANRPEAAMQVGYGETPRAQLEDQLEKYKKKCEKLENENHKLSVKVAELEEVAEQKAKKGIQYERVMLNLMNAEISNTRRIKQLETDVKEQQRKKTVPGLQATVEDEAEEEAVSEQG
jgi:hypothetical protein